MLCKSNVFFCLKIYDIYIIYIYNTTCIIVTHHVPKCMSYHKAIGVITSRANYFHDCIHIYITTVHNVPKGMSFHKVFALHGVARVKWNTFRGISVFMPIQTLLVSRSLSLSFYQEMVNRGCVASL